MHTQEIFCHVQNGFLVLPLTSKQPTLSLYKHNVKQTMEIKCTPTHVNIFGYLVIALLGTVSNFNSLNGDFVFDDAEALINNKDILPETPLTNVFQNDYWGTNLKHNSSHKSYRPLTILSFRLNYIAFGGLHSWSFHCVNVALHVIVSVLSWSVFRKILGEQRALIGFLAAVLFSVHPVHSEAVCGVVGRADLLSALFFFLSFLAFSKSNIKGCFSWVWICLSVALAGVSMFCKEQGVTVIGVLCVYDILFIHRLRIQDLFRILQDVFSRNKYSQFISIFKRQFTLVSSAALLIWLRCYLMDFQSPTFQKVDNPASFEKDWLTRVLTYNYLFSLNLWILLCPEWLCFDWSMGCVPVVTATDLRAIFVVIFWLCFGYVIMKAVTIQNAERQRSVVISLALMVIPFLPASNLLFTVGFVIAERVLYIPSTGFCLLIACGVEILIQNFPANKNDLTLGFSLLAIVFLIRSYERSSDWRTEESLFNSGSSVCPLNAKIHYNIAKSAVDTGDTDKAIAEYREAIRLFPEYDQAFNNLANILKTKGEMDEAEKLLRRALEIRNDFPAAWMNLGIVMAQTKRYTEAEKCYQNALKHRKNYPDCYYNMGNLFLDQNRHKEAERAWLIATKLKPTFAIAWSNLIILNDNNGNHSRAVSLANEALTFLPNDPGIHFNLANALGKSGEFQQSEYHFLQALKLNPMNAQYHVNLGVLYHRWKKYRNAMECYRKALKINPNLKSAKENFEMVKKKIVNID